MGSKLYRNTLSEDFGRAGGKSLDDYNALRNLKEGEISDAYQTEDWMGNQLSKIVKLVKVIPPHKVSLDEDYIRVEQLALNAKREKVFKGGSTRRSRACTFISIPNFGTESSKIRTG